MRLLLDTHAVLWAVAAPDRLSSAAREAIVDAENVVLVSAVSQWEVSIKRALGKLTFEGPLASHLIANDFSALPITLEHADAVAGLPPHHRDPFDRMLVAQAQTEAAMLVTRDPAMSMYDVSTLPA